jgi:hypothetical protein
MSAKVLPVVIPADAGIQKLDTNSSLRNSSVLNSIFLFLNSC